MGLLDSTLSCTIFVREDRPCRNTSWLTCPLRVLLLQRRGHARHVLVGSINPFYGMAPKCADGKPKSQGRRACADRIWPFSEAPMETLAASHQHGGQMDIHHVPDGDDPPASTPGAAGALHSIHPDCRPTMQVDHAASRANCSALTANVVMISLAIGSSTVVAILARYINSRKSITNWTPQQGTGNTSQSGATIQSNTEHPSQGKSPARQGLYDRWLMIRFTCAFVVLA